MMWARVRAWVCVSWIVVGLPGQDPVGSAPDFTREVRPVLEKCVRCHGPRRQRKSLRVDTAAAILAGGRSGPAVAPGDADGSLLMQHVLGVAGKRIMPPKGDRLTDDDVALLRAWIEGGAPGAGAGEVVDRRHWAYIAPRPQSLPAVERAAWVQTDLDGFVLRHLESRRVSPSLPASRETWLRRVSLDLIGLPPTGEEVASYLADLDEGAEARVVDRLLASPRYGERWAQAWLDLARYADTRGYEKDARRTMWPYRDWVIDAFNADLPFDEFTRLQLAGDMIPGAGEAGVIASAFHRNTMTNDEGGTDNEEFRVEAVADRIETTMQVWMGTTLGCARCHDHKYDPLSQREYYELFAFFNNTEDADRGDDAPTLARFTPAQESELATLRRNLADLIGSLPEPADDQAEPDERVVELEKKIAAVTPGRMPIMRELAGDQRRSTHILERGFFASPGDAVEPGIPAVFGAAPADLRRDRLGLADWLMAPENPLTARVAVNRLWEHLFGRGLVETSEDFGTQGEPPTHPELLDWLAARFVKLGWSQKAMLREIVLSATYRQSSAIRPDVAERDPHNTWLWRGPRYRLPAEMVRDQALSVAGILSDKLKGPSVMPVQPEGLWQVVYSADRWVTSEGEDGHRRALYTFWRRTNAYPSLTVFDAPSREFCVVRRSRTNTPLQALVTLNDPVYVEAAVELAVRMVEAASDPDERVAFGLRRSLMREPRATEVDRLVALYRTALNDYRADVAAADAATAGTAGDDPAELAAWSLVAGVILNLDEFLTKS